MVINKEGFDQLIKAFEISKQKKPSAVRYHD